MSPEDPRHGTVAGYVAHRNAEQDTCLPCRRARIRYEKGRLNDAHQGQPRLIDATGTRRRIQALVALGWTYGQIGERLGITCGGVYRTVNRQTEVRRSVAERVAVVYAELSTSLPPERTKQEKRDAGYARTIARKHGWLTPAWWDDIDTDEQPAIDKEGRRTDDETAAEWAHFQAAGESIHACAKALGVSVGAIEKACERTRKAAA